MNHIYRFSIALTVILLCSIFKSCTDDFNPDFGVIDGSIRDLNIEVGFDADNSIDLRSRSGSEDGTSIQDIHSLRMLIYGSDDKLLYNYLVYKNDQPVLNENISNVSYSLSDNRLPSESGLGDDSAGKLTFNLKLATGRYKIYAVVNVDDIPEGTTDASISNPEALKSIRRTWESTLAKNSEMFGIFSLEPNRDATDQDAIAVTSKTHKLHAWVRRLASKVTVAFDGTELYDNVQVYIETVALKDIPKTCYLGKPNVPGIDSEFEKTYDYANLYKLTAQPKMQASAQRYTVSNGVIKNGGMDEIQKVNTDIPVIPDDYFHLCNKRHPYFGMGPDSDNSNDETIIDDAHLHTAKSFFFYENMQGLTGEGRYKYQDEDKNGTINWPSPVENDLESGWKDTKAYGTYVEVTGYYRCATADGHVSSGPIIYRFMLGQNDKDDFNAVRNTHYKLTLKFKGYGNDADWHIEYKYKRGIEIQSPMYISYLFNKKMMATVKVSGKLPEGAKLRADITECSWKPWGAVNDPDASFPIPPASFYSPVSKNDLPCNSFLSLRKTTVTKIEIPGMEGVPSNQYDFTDSWDYNETYYSANDRGWREYEITPKSTGYESNDEDGMYFVSKLSEDANGNPVDRLFTIPLYTRAKELITRTSFTGNNPWTEYPRSGKIRFTVVDANNNPISGFEPAELQVIQVRRIVNPKGVWRKSGSTSPFRVTLTRLKNENSDFTEFNSQGKWSAEVISEPGNEGVISLSSTTKGSGEGNRPHSYVKRIEGESEHPIDFNINFHGKNGSAIVRIRYHNYTCEHDIFCREGYDPVDISGKGKAWWPSYNVDHFDGTKAVYTKSPLQQGSYFRLGNYTAILAENDERAGFGFNSAPPSEFNVLKNDGTKTSMLWGNIKPATFGTNPSIWPISNENEHIANGEDFYEFVSNQANESDFDISKGYGVLYGDGAEETQTKLDLVYGYNRTDGADDIRGMRGVFVYNNKTTNQIFLPIGITGHGHRQNKGGSNNGTLRYAGREALMTTKPADLLSVRPLFYDLYKRPGAIYWLEHFYASMPQVTKEITKDGKTTKVKFHDAKKSSAFDINYYTMGFEGYGGNDAVPGSNPSNSHGCLMRTVLSTAPTK